MTDDREAILAEVIEFSRAPTLEPWQFTVRQYAQARGIKEAIAYDELQGAVAAGMLETAYVKHNGRRVRAFWKRVQGAK